MTIYEIGNDYKALLSLLESMTDPETGETREFTEEEKKFFTESFKECGENFKTKFDNIYKVYRNLMAQSEVADAEKASLQSEMDRLRKRAKTRENEANRLKSLIAYAMDVIKERKIKTDLFSCGWQVTQKSVKQDIDYSHYNIPYKYLKGELSAKAIKDAIEKGHLYEKDDPLQKGKLFYQDENGNELFLKGVSYLGGEALVIR